MTALIALLLAGFYTTSYFHQAAALHLGSITAIMPADDEVQVFLQKGDQNYSVEEIAEICQEPCDLSGEFETSFDIFDLQPAQLSFKLKIDPEESLNGFDRPYFSVFIDGEVIYQENYNPALPNPGNWRRVWVPLLKLTAGHHKLTFTQTNTGDDLFGVAVSLSKLSTATPLLGEADKLIFKSSNAEAVVKVQSPSWAAAISAVGQITLSSQDLASVSSLEYWLERDGDVVSTRKTLDFVVDLQPPQLPAILDRKEESDGTTTIRVAASNDVYKYEIGPTLIHQVRKSFGSSTDILQIPGQSSLMEVRVIDFSGNKSSWQSIWGGTPL